MDKKEQDEIARIAELKGKLDEVKRTQARRYHAPDSDPTVIYVMIETIEGGGERFLRSTVSATLSGCHSHWRNRDTFMETEVRQIRVVKVRMIEI